MSPELAAEVWRIVKEHIPFEDRPNLAEQIVTMLCDQGVDLEDIRYEFSDDTDIQRSVKFYADEDIEDDEYDDEWSGDDDEESQDW